MYYLVLPEKPVENLSETELKKIAAAAPGGYDNESGFRVGVKKMRAGRSRSSADLETT